MELDRAAADTLLEIPTHLGRRVNEWSVRTLNLQGKEHVFIVALSPGMQVTLRFIP